MSEDLLSFPSGSASLDDPSSQPVESSGISDSSLAPAALADVHVCPRPPQRPAATSKAKEQITYVCQRCGKVYVRKHYYDKHVIAHDISGMFC